MPFAPCALPPLVSNHSLDRAAGRGIELFRYPAGLVSETAGEHAVLHRLRHRDRVPCPGNGRIQQNGVTSQFHGQRDIRCGADAGIHDDGDFHRLHNDPDIIGVPDAETGPYRRSERHDRRAAYVHELFRHDRIVARVGQDNEPLLHQHLRSLERGLVVREEGLLVADHFELHELRDPGLRRKHGCADGVFCRIAAGGIRKNLVLLRVDVIEQVLLALVDDVYPPDRHGHHVGARHLDGLFRFREVLVLSRAHPEAGVKFDACDYQFIIVHIPTTPWLDFSFPIPKSAFRNPQSSCPPPIKLTTSRLSPSLIDVSPYLSFFTISVLSSTATRWCWIFKKSSKPTMVMLSGTSFFSPFRVMFKVASLSRHCERNAAISPLA